MKSEAIRYPSSFGCCNKVRLRMAKGFKTIVVVGEQIQDIQVP
jgi:hypothetical protein